MSDFLQLFVLVPLLGFFVSLFIPQKNEDLLANIVWATVGIQGIGTLLFVGYWMMNGFQILDLKHITLYQNADFEFFIDFYFDKITAVFATVGAILVFLVAVFSRYYMHRDEGFKRFFNLLLFFFTGYNLVVFSGNFETLFVGWEVLGLCSFLLIAFYRDRYLPVKNGYKVISFYRLSDISLILAMWVCHHLWHKNITFIEWNDAAGLHESVHHNPIYLTAIVGLIVLAAAIKSAQMPFSTWLPRAMEGPTTSSAIFYGSLSVHIGVFMLLRTAPLWEHETLIKGIIISIGLATSFIATTIARVQSTVKTQIAYASVTQIGLMFVEVALGFHTLALIHFTSNAFLRTYQLLVSPSVLGYKVHDMFFNFKPYNAAIGNSFFQKISQTLYVLGLKEWNLDSLLRRFLWSPFKWVGSQLRFLNTNGGYATLVVLLILGAVGMNSEKMAGLKEYAPLGFAAIALMMILKAFSERGDARRAWFLLFFSQLFIALAIVSNSKIELQQVAIYLSGSCVAFVVGYFCLNKIHAIDGDIVLNQYHGYSHEEPKMTLIFILAGLGLLGFPITPTFIGIDLMFNQVGTHQIPLITIMALNFLFLELSILRIYTRIFLGQHKKQSHQIAFKSS